MCFQLFAPISVDAAVDIFPTVLIADLNTTPLCSTVAIETAHLSQFLLRFGLMLLPTVAPAPVDFAKDSEPVRENLCLTTSCTNLNCHLLEQLDSEEMLGTTRRRSAIVPLRFEVCSFAASSRAAKQTVVAV